MIKSEAQTLYCCYYYTALINFLTFNMNLIKQRKNLVLKETALLLAKQALSTPAPEELTPGRESNPQQFEFMDEKEVQKWLVLRDEDVRQKE